MDNFDSKTSGFQFTKKVILYNFQTGNPMSSVSNMSKTGLTLRAGGINKSLGLLGGRVGFIRILDTPTKPQGPRRATRAGQLTGNQFARRSKYCLCSDLINRPGVTAAIQAANKGLNHRFSIGGIIGVLSARNLPITSRGP